MAPKSMQPSVKSILVTQSRIKEAKLEDLEETEIAAQITVPHEEGWGWVVVAAAFTCILAIDSTAMTFGSLLQDITKDMQQPESLITVVNSLAIALYFMAGPCASAFINRFGFRACAMSGAVIDSIAFLCTYYSTNYFSLCLFYGVLAGIGFCFISMSSCLIVTFYFEKLRSLALSIAFTGSSVGIMAMYPLNSYIVNVAGWRVATLLHSSMFGLVFFLGMTFKPLLSLEVAQTTVDNTKTVTYLPSVQVLRTTPAGAKSEGIITATKTEKMFGAVSNMNFPTVAEMVKNEDISTTQPQGPSRGTVSKITVTARSGQSGLSHRQLNQVKSIISRTGSAFNDKSKKSIEVTVNVKEELQKKKLGFWARIFHWEEHISESRPMYRDDAFYQGNLENLDVYKKSMMDTTGQKTGLEYQLAVSRAVTTADLQDHRGVFTTAVRRILATMMDPGLLRRPSFLLLCFCGFVTYLGCLVPYVYVAERNKLQGIESSHCTLFVSVIGFANAIGRLVVGALACRISSIKLYIVSCLASGITAAVSNLSFNLYFQYVFCFVYGFFVASISSLRSSIIADLYGLEKLTNATGMLLIFLGIGALLGTPLASIFKDLFSYEVSFYIAGGLMIFGGVFSMRIESMGRKERYKLQN